jgi:hypothetical protein
LIGKFQQIEARCISWERTMCKDVSSMVGGLVGKIAMASALLMAAQAVAQQSPVFTPGNLVVAVEGCGVQSGNCVGVTNGNGTGAGNSSLGGYGDNQAGPFTLFQFAPVGTASATYVNSLVLPQTMSGGNFPVSGEYGSSSEGTLQLSGSGQYLTVMGYGVNAADFDANPPMYGAAPSNALGQSGSLAGQSYTAVPRVVALIDAYGNVNSSTALYNIFDTNNPRSAFAANGATVYVSGQGNGSDLTGGVFFSPIGAVNNAPVAITWKDTTNNTLSQDTRDVQIYNGTLYVSVDTKGGSGSARSYIGTLGTAGAPPTTTVGAPVMLNGFGNSGGTGKVTINGNGNNLNAGLQINLSPVNYFFANASTLYVADSGNPKNNSATSSLGNGGLQKWVNSAMDGSGTWSLAYTLYNGLNLVANSKTTGTTGLYGLTGTVSGGVVALYATNYTLNDLDFTYLYGITDTLSTMTAGQAAGEMFTQLAAAPMDSNFKGVSFAPLVAPAITWSAPGAIAFGSALSGEQLDATAGVPGSFVYSPPAGTVLPVGAGQTLSVTFTPTDTTDYATATASTTITVNSTALSASPVDLIVTKTMTRSGAVVLVQVTVANAGGTAASNVVLTGVKVGADLATPLPLGLGTIAAGASATATVSVPGSVGASGAASSVTISGTYSGGSFGSSWRAALP